MRKFLNGERTFKKDELVYFINDLGFIDYGLIDYYYRLGEYCITLYCVKDTRLVDGVPISDIDYNKEYPLPKKWTYNTKLFEVTNSEEYENISNAMKNVKLTDKDKILECIKKGYLVKKSTVPLGYVTTDVLKKTYKLRFQRNEKDKVEETIHESKIFRTYDEAMQYKKSEQKKKEDRKRMFDSMSESEQSLFEIREYLEKINISNNEIDDCIKLINEMEDCCPEDIEIRVIRGEIQYRKFDSKEWKHLMKLVVLDEPVHNEKYYVSVTHIWDNDQIPIFKTFTDDPPEYWFEKYNDYKEYKLCVANRRWKLENGLDAPARYELGVIHNNSCSLTPVLIEKYITEHGDFDIINGELGFFDITIDYKHSVNSFCIIMYQKNTSMNEEEIKSWYVNKIKSMFGKFSQMFEEKIMKMEDIRIC